MQAMRRAIQHRDWYKTDSYVSPDGSVSIARVHLGIIHPHPQPYSAPNGRVHVLMHGQVYADPAVQANPLQLVYELYEKKGMDFAASLNGSFVVVIVDEDEGSVLIANDRLASQPLFVLNQGSAVYFGPEIKSLLLAPGLKREVNLAAVADFLANGYLTREHNFIQNLETLDGASVLKISPGGIARHTYWEHPFKYGFPPHGQERSQATYQEQLASLIRQAVSRSLRHDTTYGILLSGGYDSRGILGCYLEARGQRELHTISWGREENIPGSDCVIARQVAEKVGADHHFYQRPLTEVLDDFREFILLGEGRTDDAASYAVFDRIKKQQGIDILLRGDELFGSLSRLVYDQYSMLRSLGVRVLGNIREYQRVLKPTYFRTMCQLNADTYRQVSAQCSAPNLRDRKDFFDATLLMQHYLNPLNYIKTFVMETLNPFLDYDLLDYVFGLPTRYRVDKILYRQTITAMFPGLFEETAQTGNIIDWAAAFKSSPELQRFAYRELVEQPNAFSEWIDPGNLKRELDIFFTPARSPKSPRPGPTLKGNALKLLTRWPATRNLAHRGIHHVQKWRGISPDSLPLQRLIMRLLILKIWGDVFMNYPAARISENSGPELVRGAQPAHTPSLSRGSKL
jgi:asparagine synthetase B (glutamine-hydrolysing)